MKKITKELHDALRAGAISLETGITLGALVLWFRDNEGSWLEDKNSTVYTDFQSHYGTLCTDQLKKEE